MFELRKYLIPISLFFIVLIFSLYSFDRNVDHITLRRAKMFELRVDQAIRDIILRMEDFEQLLKASRSLLLVKDSVTRNDWLKFVDNLQIENNFPGVQGLGYAVVTDPKGIKRITENIRKSGQLEFQHFPESKEEMMTSIIFLEPFKGRNLRAIGYDMFTEPIRRKAMQAARDSNKAVLSGRVFLIQENRLNKQPGFLMYLPVYRKSVPTSLEERKKHLTGFVYIPFRSGDVMEKILSEEYPDLQFKIYAGSDKIENSQIFPTREQFVEVQSKPEFVKDTTFALKGTTWHMDASTSIAFGSTYEKRQPYLILFSGIIISTLLLILSLLELQRKEQTMKELELVRTLDRKKEEFIGIASHELKTPLTSLKAYIQLLERTSQKNDYQKAELYINRASSHLNKIQELISDLLDVSKIEAGKLTLNKEQFDFDDFARNVIESFRPTSEKHQLVLIGETKNAQVCADKNRIEQVITNLLTNAIKYSPDADRIDIILGKDNDNVTLQVRDYGIGIPVEKQQMIFNRFYRVENENHKFQGLGIGLYISYQMIKNHDGEIGVNSNPDIGSTFYFNLPAVKS